MQVTVETTSGLERRMKVVVPSALVEDQIKEKLNKAASSASIKGFRPGKVPMREIKRRFGTGIRQEVSGELIQSKYFEAVQQESLKPAGMPNIEDMISENGKDLEFVAIFEVYPDITLSDFSELEIEKSVATVAESDLERTIDEVRKQQMKYAPVKRKAKLEDQLNIDFEGFVNGEAFAGGQGEGVDLILGSNSMIPGFEDGLKGAKSGEEPVLNLAFPEAYHAEELAGADVEFKVKINSVSKPVLPELDEELFTTFGIKEGGLEEFRSEIRSNMEKELNSAIKNNVKKAVLDALLSTARAELPAALVDLEINRMRQEAIQQFGGQNAAQIDPSILPAEMFNSQAERRVSLGLLMSEILQQESIEVDKDRVKETIEEMASSYEDSKQVVDWYYSNEQQLSQIENMVLEDQVVDLILGKAQVNETEISYEEAIKPPAPEAETETETETDASDADTEKVDEDSKEKED
jgi:trigger factor